MARHPPDERTHRTVKPATEPHDIALLQEVRSWLRCKTVCPPLLVRWLALDCASEGCSGEPSRSSPQEDEPWQIIRKHLSESMSQS